MKKVCYFTSKSQDDVRVFVKECHTLVNNGYDVTLVCPNAENSIIDGIKIVGVKFDTTGFLDRNVLLPKLLYNKAISLDADIYHFNDPGCLRYVKRMKRLGKKVVFDSFEDHPSLLFEKKNIPNFFISLFSWIYTKYEIAKTRDVDGILCCYHWTKDRLQRSCTNIGLVFNFPIIKGELPVNNIMQGDKVSIGYAGLISHIWNFETLIDALPKAGVIINIAGWGRKDYLNKLKGMPGWKNVNYYGKLSREEVVEKIYNQSDIGIAILDYLPLCKRTKGNLSNNKIFEYMMQGLPLICTDFELWKEVVQDNNCGICINSKDSDEVANAIKYLSENKPEAIQMGLNGQKMVKDHYNWETQAQTLLNIYSNL